MVIYSYECKKCKNEQDKMFSDTEEKKNPPCEKCGEETKRIISWRGVPHVSWSQWSV